MESTYSYESTRAGRRPLVLIFAVVLMDLIGLSILYPVAPYAVRQYTTDALAVSMVTVLYAGAQFFAAPILGRLSDRYGRRPVLLISILGSALGYYLFGVGGALWVLFLSRLIDGVTGGNISTASAYIADITPPQDRAKNYGLLGAAFGLGFVLGPALGGALSQISLSAPAFAAGTFSLLSAVAGYFMLPESLPKEKRLVSPLAWSDVNPFASIADLLRRPVIRNLLVTMSIFVFVFNGRNTVLPVLAIDWFGAQPWEIASIIVAGGIAMVIVQATLVGRMVKRYGERKLAYSTLVIQAFAIFVTAVAPALWTLYPISVLTSASAGFIWPTMGALLANSVAPEEQGKVNGVNTSLGSLMGVLGPLWAGAVYDSIAPSAPFWMGGVLFILAGILLARGKVSSRSEHSAAVQSAAE